MRGTKHVPQVGEPRCSCTPRQRKEHGSAKRWLWVGAVQPTRRPSHYADSGAFGLFGPIQKRSRRPSRCLSRPRRTGRSHMVPCKTPLCQPGRRPRQNPGGRWQDIGREPGVRRYLLIQSAVISDVARHPALRRFHCHGGRVAVCPCLLAPGIRDPRRDPGRRASRGTRYPVERYLNTLTTSYLFLVSVPSENQKHLCFSQEKRSFSGNLADSLEKYRTTPI